MPVIPTSPAFSSVSVRRTKSTPFTRSPFTGDLHVYEWVGSGKYEWDAALPPIKDVTTKAAWIDFLVDLEGMAETFTFDLNATTQGSIYNYAQGQTSPTLWRLREPVVGWTISSSGFLTGITIKAIEA